MTWYSTQISLKSQPSSEGQSASPIFKCKHGSEPFSTGNRVATLNLQVKIGMRPHLFDVFHFPRFLFLSICFHIIFWLICDLSPEHRNATSGYRLLIEEWLGRCESTISRNGRTSSLLTGILLHHPMHFSRIAPHRNRCFPDCVLSQPKPHSFSAPYSSAQHITCWPE